MNRADAPRPEIKVMADPEALASFAAQELAREIREAIASRGEAAVALPGGSTPRRMLESLARVDALPWAKVVLIPGDERLVEVGDERSNEGMIRSSLVQRIVGQPPIVLGWQVEAGLGPMSVAHRFEGRLLGVLPMVEGLPRLDSLTLGLGGDGHTASLFPGKAYPPEAVVLTSESPDGLARLSLGPLILTSARRIHFLVDGEQKADILRQVLEGEYDPVRLPAQLLLRNLPGCGVWCDQAAASRLTA